MDAGATGALIGLSFMVAFGICVKVYDIWSKRQARQPTVETPLMAMNETSFRIVRQHSKINMILPK